MRTFDGRKVICGGTTANIVSRLLQPARRDGLEPNSIRKFRQPAVMEGVDLVTEGTVTLAKVAEMLERRRAAERGAQKTPRATWWR